MVVTSGNRRRLRMKYPSKWNRFWNRVHARIEGYFWVGCPNCGRFFGAHEMGKWGVAREGSWWKTCKWCDDDRELEIKWRKGHEDCTWQG